MNDLRHRRPSYLNQHWISLSLASATCAALLPTLVQSVYSGELQCACAGMLRNMHARLQDYVVVPVYELVERIFLTIRHRGEYT